MSGETGPPITPGEPVAVGKGVGPVGGVGPPGGVGVGEPGGPPGVGVGVGPAGVGVGVGEGGGTIREVTVITFVLLVAIGVTRPLFQRPISTLAG